MSLVFDPITVLNLTFDLVIVGLGVFAYLKLKSLLAALIALAFAFFASSYVLTILGYGSSTYLLLPLRILGYLSVIAALVWYLYRARSPSAAPASTTTS